MSSPVTVVTGNDPVLVSGAVGPLVDDLVGDQDRSLVVGEVVIEKPESGDVDITPVVDAASTPPFLTDSRVVVVRGTSFSNTKALAPLVAYLEDPLPTTTLVLVWDKQHGQQQLPAVPKALKEAVAAAGGQVVDTKPGRDTKGWIDEQVAASGLELTKDARSALVQHLGDDVARLGGILSTLETTFGPGVTIGPDELEPYLGEAGGVPPWDLTDAIDKGDRARALEVLHRMLQGGDRHPLQIMATLTTHYGRVLRLDGADVVDDKAAAALLGMKGSTFPAKKALGQARALGPEKVARALGLLGEADLDLRGQKAWPDELVLEVLVARLAFLSRR